MVITFCGHREVQEPEKVRKWLYETVAGLIREGADCFYLGGYGQFNTMAADVIRELKQECPHTRSVLVLPYLDREATLKRFYPEPENHRIRLHPENSHMKDFYVDRCEIQGIAVKVLKELL